MNSITSVDTSFYSELIEGFAPKTLQAIAAVDENTTTRQVATSFNDGSKTDTEVNFKNYYDDVKIENWLSNLGNNVVNSIQNLNTTMMTAIQNGYTVQDACNIRLADIAYKANARVFDIASEISTFSLDV